MNVLSDFETLQMAQTPRGPIAYRRAGSGPTLVLLHPLALSGAVWRPVVERLAGDFDIIAPDARGHGDTPWDGEPFSMEDLAADVIALIGTITDGPVVLGGASMGGSTAMVAAPQLSDRLRALVLLDTTAWYGADAPETWAGRAQKASSTPREQQLPFQLDRWFTPDTAEHHPEIVDPVVDAFLATNSAAHAAASVAMGNLDARPGLASVTVPTLVLTGADDYATPPVMGRLAAESVQNGEFRELSGARHLGLLERPELADQVTAFVTQRAEV